MAVEHLGSMLLNGMSHEAVRVVGCRWIRKTVTTDPPRYIPHTEYSWVCELVGEVPILAALILENGAGLRWARSGRRSGAPELVVSLSFQPYDWNASDKVGITLSQPRGDGLSCVQVAVHDDTLKRDPCRFARFDLSEGGVAETGSLIRMGTITTTSRESVTVGLVVVALTDTESCRCGRWRVRRRIPLAPPVALSFLGTGRRAGFSLRHGGIGGSVPEAHDPSPSAPSCMTDRVRLP